MLLAALACTAAGAGVAAEPPKVVRDPHYGDTLFHFYQGRYFSAITGLMASQHFDRVPLHADEAEVLRGGMLLSYGLHREAGTIFAQLIDKGASPAVRDRAWFYLAKIRYQRGFLAEAEAAVARIDKHLPPDLEEERGLLRAQLLMARDDHAGAAAVLKGMAAGSNASLYARYNLGVALVKSGEAAAGSELLDAVGKVPGPTEEVRSLRDKANVALGFTALQADRPAAARTALERVRLQGMHSNKALLGFGWAAASLKEPRLALLPWTELAGRDGSDAAVLEARIAVPYAYAELGAYGQSLEGYEKAIAAFELEGRQLDESIAAIRAGKLLEGLLEQNPGDEMGWFWQIGKLPSMPHAGHLAPLLAQHEFQEAFKNFRDLRFLAKNLQGWADNLGVYSDMLEHRRRVYAERLPQVQAQSKDTGIEALQRRRDAVAADVTRAEADADGVALADTKQRELLARIEGARALLQQAAAEPEAAAAKERLRLAAGALSWDLAQAQSARLWDAKKAMQAIDTQLADARRREVALVQAQRDEPKRFDAFADRIAALRPQLQVLIPRVAALGAEQQGAVQDLAIAELSSQKERLAVYTTQARFAMAQLYDRANVARGGSDAPKN